LSSWPKEPDLWPRVLGSEGHNSKVFCHRIPSMRRTAIVALYSTGCSRLSLFSFFVVDKLLLVLLLLRCKVPLIRLKRIHNCFYTICLVFRYTSWHFYAFSGTNLLTRCHRASSLFSTVFVFQKSYIGNILGIGWNKSRTSENLPKLPENRRGDGGGPRAGHTIGRRGLPLARAPWWWGHPGPPLTLPLRL
jgi:hypothetical protein